MYLQYQLLTKEIKTIFFKLGLTDKYGDFMHIKTGLSC